MSNRFCIREYFLDMKSGLITRQTVLGEDTGRRCTVYVLWLSPACVEPNKSWIGFHSISIIADNLSLHVTRPAVNRYHGALEKSYKCCLHAFNFPFEKQATLYQPTLTRSEGVKLSNLGKYQNRKLDWNQYQKV